MSKTCQVTKYSKGYHPTPSYCGRPAKGALKDGTPACGVHLASERTREKADFPAECLRSTPLLTGEGK